MKHSVALSCCALALMSLPTAAHAQLLDGQTIGAEYRFPDLGSPYSPTAYAPQSFVVGAGQESTIVLEGVTTFNVDFSDMALDVVFDTVLTNPTFGSSAFNGLVFTSSAFPGVTGVTVDAMTNLVGFDASRVSIVGDELRLDWNGLTYNTDTVVALTFSGVVPEPATWAMMIGGVGLVGASLRRRRMVTRATVSFA